MLERLNSTLALDNPILANDSDPTETAEWLDALESVFRMVGGERAEFILSALGRKGTNSLRADERHARTSQPESLAAVLAMSSPWCRAPSSSSLLG